MEYDLLFVGPMNEFVTAPIGEAMFLLITLGWLGLNVAASYMDLVDDSGNPKMTA